jgi:membrane protease YdiL (CAAX protease family)
MTMTGTLIDAEAPHGRAAVGLIVTCACALLASRAWMPPLAGIAQPLVGVVLFASILAASSLVPVRPSDGRRGTPIALAIGVAAVVGAAIVAGAPVPIVMAWWTLPVSLLAAVAEEALFRRAAYAELERWGVFAAVAGSAALFAATHLPLYGIAALPVDFGAGLVFGWQRWATGSWAVPAATHAGANMVALLR